MLSALLSGNAGGGDAPAPAEKPRVAVSKCLDRTIFPCLNYANDSGEKIENLLPEDYELPDIAKLRAKERKGPPVEPMLPDGTPADDYTPAPGRPRGGAELPTGSVTTGQGFSLPSHHNTMLNEGVIGSLPKGLTAEERSSVRKSVPMSPSLNLLAELPEAQVTARTAEGKKLRRNIVRGAVVAFITAGYSGKRFVFEKAKEIGVRSVILDTANGWATSLVGEGIIEKYVPFDFSEGDTVFDRALTALKQVRSELGELDGVVTFCELAMPLVARLSERLGLPGNMPLAVDTARDKSAARQCMEQAALPTPKHFLITEGTQLDAAAEHVGFPAVIKPIHGAASIGVLRVNDIDQLRTNYARVVSDMSKCRVVAGALMEGKDPKEEANAGSVISLSIMMEEYLDGPEVDCDLIFSEGKCVYGSVCDNWPTIEPYFNETGSNMPSQLSLKKQSELLQLAIAAVECMAFESGVFHCELKYTSRGARLIEVNCRMGGGPVRNMNLLVWGVDLVEEAILCACGIPSRPVIAPYPINCIGEFSVNAPRSGTLAHIDYCAPFQGKEHIHYCRPTLKPGAKVVCVEDGLPTWCAEMMLLYDNIPDAIAGVKKLSTDVQNALPII